MWNSAALCLGVLHLLGALATINATFIGIEFPSKQSLVGAAGLEHLYVLPSDMGVEHYQILGPAGRGRHVILHLLTKFTGHVNDRFFYAKAWIEYEYGTDFMPFHHNYIGHLPNMSLQAHSSNRTFPLTLYNHTSYAVHVESVFVDDSTTYTLKFHAQRGKSRWRRTQVLRPYEWRLPVLDRHPKGIADVPRVVAVYSPIDTFFFKADPAHTIKVLLYHMSYHLRLGYSGFIMYSRPYMVEVLLVSPAIRALIASGQLLFVLWDWFPMHGHGHYTDQWVSYYHANVALAGEHVLLHFLDMDEFVASDEHISSVSALIQGGCMGQSAYYRFYQRDYRISPDRLATYGPNTTERDVWMAQNVSDPLKLYSEYRLMYSPNAAASHQVSKYMASPSLLLNYNNHNARTKPNTTRADVHWSCVYLAHLSCLYRNRPGPQPWRTNGSWFYLRSTNTIII